MGRPSKLTAMQWASVERRLMQGESASALAREFGISEAAIRKRFGKFESVGVKSAKVREVAQILADADMALQTLAPSQRAVAIDMAEKLRNISGSLASAAELGAKTAHRLNALANTEVNKVDDANPLASLEELRSVGVLTKLANDSSHIALNLLAANKGRFEETPADPNAAPTSGVLVVPGLATDPAAWSGAVQQAALPAGEG